MPTLKLSEQSVKSLMPLVGKDTFYYDSELTGFGVKVAASGTRSYFIETRIQKGRPAKRKKLGGCDRMKASEAREQARRDLAQMVMGFDPVSQRKDVEKAKVTLRIALEGRIESRKLKAKTAYDYRQIAAKALGDWMDRPLSTISEQMAVDRHSDLASKNGPAYANLAMRILSAAHGQAVGQHGLQATNPVARLRKGQMFKKVSGVDVDTVALKNAVATSFAGGYTKRNGEASAGTGAIVKPAAIGSGRWIKYGPNTVIDRLTGVVMLKKTAAMVGYVDEEAKA